MTNRQRAAVAVGSIVVVVGGVAYAVGAGPFSTESIDVCVSLYEDPGQSGDALSVCDTSPSNVKIPNLGTHTEGLHSGCNRVLNTSSTWTDCVSSSRVNALPGSQKVVFYQDTNYGNAIKCVDTNGTTTQAFTGGQNDILSSFRILSGNC